MLMHSLERFTDVNFTDESAAYGVLMGAKSDRGDWCCGMRPDFGAAGLTLVPDDQWLSIIRQKDAEHSWASELITRVFNQNGDPSCVTNASMQAMQVCMAQQWSKRKVIDLAVSSIYPLVGNRTSGSSISSNISKLTDIGAVPVANAANLAHVAAKRFAHTMPENGFPKRPDGVEQTAKLFRLDEVIDVRNFREAVSCLLQDWGLIYARSGHCIYVCRIVADAANNLKFAYCNSWGAWGAPLNDEFNYGVGFDSLSTFKAASDWCVAVRSIYTPSFVFDPAWN